MLSEYQRWKRVVAHLRGDYDRAKLMPIDTVQAREYRSAAMQSAGARMIQLETLSGVSIFGPHGQSRDMNDRLAALDDYADSLAARSLGYSSVPSDNLRYIDLTGGAAAMENHGERSQDPADAAGIESGAGRAEGRAADGPGDGVLSA